MRCSAALTSCCARLWRELRGSRALWGFCGWGVRSAAEGQRALHYLAAHKAALVELALSQFTPSPSAAHAAAVDVLNAGPWPARAWVLPWLKSAMSTLAGSQLRVLDLYVEAPVLLADWQLDLPCLEELALEFGAEASTLGLGPDAGSRLRALTRLAVKMAPHTTWEGINRPAPPEVEIPDVSALHGSTTLAFALQILRACPELSEGSPRRGGAATRLEPGCLPPSLHSLSLTGLPSVGGQLLSQAGNATGLTSLWLSDCGGLERLPPQLAGLAGSLQRLGLANGCVDPEEEGAFAPLASLTRLTMLSLENHLPANRLRRVPAEIGALQVWRADAVTHSDFTLAHARSFLPPPDKCSRLAACITNT